MSNGKNVDRITLDPVDQEIREHVHRLLSPPQCIRHPYLRIPQQKPFRPLNLIEKAAPEIGLPTLEVPRRFDQFPPISSLLASG